jgi:hypothetical protein
MSVSGLCVRAAAAAGTTRCVEPLGAGEPARHGVGQRGGGVRAGLDVDPDPKPRGGLGGHRTDDGDERARQDPRRGVLATAPGKGVQRGWTGERHHVEAAVLDQRRDVRVALAGLCLDRAVRHDVDHPCPGRPQPPGNHLAPALGAGEQHAPALEGTGGQQRVGCGLGMECVGHQICPEPVVREPCSRGRPDGAQPWPAAARRSAVAAGAHERVHRVGAGEHDPVER